MPGTDLIAPRTLAPPTTQARRAPQYPVVRTTAYAFRVAELGLLRTAVTKTLRVPCTAFTARNNTQSWQFAASAINLSPGTVNVQLIAFAPLLVPPGVTITAFRARLLRVNAGDTAQVLLVRVVAETATTIATLTSSDTLMYTTWSTTLTEVASSGRFYTAQASLTGTVTAADARMSWVEFDYTMPHIGAAY